MMDYYRKTTMMPNEIVDVHLASLSEKELKVLLVILRQTVGWITKNKERKYRDWISHRYFINKTGLVSKSVSSAITLLVHKDLIAIEDQSGRRLIVNKQRQGKFRKYYRSTLFEKVKPVKYSNVNPSILRTTKLTDTKLSKETLQKDKPIGRLSDTERYRQIMRGQGMT